MRNAKPHPIRTAREKKGLTQQQVAEAVGVSKAAVSRWESGIDRPQPPTAIRLSEVIPGLSLEQIYASAA